VYRPLVQVTHEEGEVEPVAAVPCPAAQVLHETEPVSGLNVPAAQATHAEPV
jgi:hypothetical protein